ncbi:MAPEG family protein [Sphingomonas aracearum]|uniref:MAPEG family protein n=1 Tax=Sphingomonas aracearum TaxID=2283317 RepID=A0A369VT99_9SPHN|nr:MAPEG family protein [Sphingomonas aracearum]RDE05636.1 MAPEG family protein [Sphingomonas aracearum]
MHSPILQPVVALIAWTFVMFAWMMVTRFSALSAAGLRLNKMVGTTSAHADKGLPARAQWKAHNYNHLLEQPVLFYAVCGVLALTGTGGGFNLALAWIYVALRIAHSLWQATVNRVSVRFYLFLAATVALAAMTLHAAMAVF